MTTPLTAAEVADALAVDRSTVMRLVRDGTLPATKLPGRTGAFLFQPDDVERVRLARAAELRKQLEAIEGAA